MSNILITNVNKSILVDIVGFHQGCYRNLFGHASVCNNDRAKNCNESDANCMTVRYLAFRWSPTGYQNVHARIWSVVMTKMERNEKNAGLYCHCESQHYCTFSLLC